MRSSELLRALVGPEPHKVMTARKLAERVGVSPSLISHLLTGRVRSCSLDLADQIAKELHVDTGLLFAVETSSSTQQSNNREATA